MGKKRKFESRDTSTFKPSPVEVVVENLESHPYCLHGPTLLFSSEKGRYFSCSSCRNKKDCTVHITEEVWLSDHVKKRNEKYFNLITKIDKEASWKIFNNIKSQDPADRAYCITCEELYIPSQSRKHIKDHRTVTPLSDMQLTYPSTWMPTLENNTLEAQYLFSKKSVATILNAIRKNCYRNILCIGTPSVHEAVQSSADLNSILLDYDKRHHQFYQPDKFVWYNMFNNHLFNGDDQKLLKKFMKDSSVTGLCVVLDPPFGGRVEPLIHTLKELSKNYKNWCNKDSETLPIVWAFPYFSEPYIQNMLPELQMHDYQVEYENHKKFQNKTAKGRKFGSPVRFFTNLPLETFDLSQDKRYKFCGKCKFWVAINNKHCTKCKSCTSKNGMTYKHCSVCKRCVKPTFFHCPTCERCCQHKDHVCGVIVDSQSCYNCHEKGHKKASCPKLFGQEEKRKKCIKI